MSDPGPKLLVIEDEPEIRRFLRVSLQSHGYRILDLGLPDMDGLEVIREVRQWSRMPIIILSARGQEQDKIAALDAGADDYLTKPFSVAELLARLRVALRHAAQSISGADPVFC